MPSAIFPWIAALALVALTFFAKGALGDGDTFTHIAAGSWMLDHRAVLDHDPFSYTRAGAPWLAHEWLAEVLLAGFYRFAGWGGVLVLTGLAVGLTFFQMTRHLQRWLPNLIAFLLVALAASSIIPSLLARPHILALPAFEAWVAGLFLARAAGRAPSWWLLPVMCLWANLHGGYIIGLLLVLPLALEAWLAEPGAWRKVVSGWGGFFIAAILAALLTPHGVAGLLFPFKLAGTSGLSRISEWQATDFSVFQPLELSLAVGLFFALSRGMKLPPLRLLMLLGLLHAALQHSRHQMLVAMIVPFLLAAPLGLVLPAAPSNLNPRPWWLAGAAVTLLMVMARLWLPAAPSESPTAPITAIANVPAALRSQPMLNEYSFGGYLTHAGLRPFIDGRLEVFGADFLHQYLLIIHPDKVALDAALQLYGITWSILAPGNPAAVLIDTMPGWCRIYADKFAVIQTKSCP